MIQTSIEMKKAVVIIAVAVAALMIQSCGSSEKCPAYSQVETEQEVRS